MTSRRALVVCVCLALSSGVIAQSGASPEALLKAAINREVVDGDATGAIQQYKDIASKWRMGKDSSSPRTGTISS